MNLWFRIARMSYAAPLDPLPKDIDLLIKAIDDKHGNRSKSQNTDLEVVKIEATLTVNSEGRGPSLQTFLPALVNKLAQIVSFNRLQ